MSISRTRDYKSRSFLLNVKGKVRKYRSNLPGLISSTRGSSGNRTAGIGSGIFGNCIGNKAQVMIKRGSKGVIPAKSSKVI